MLTLEEAVREIERAAAHPETGLPDEVFRLGPFKAAGRNRIDPDAVFPQIGRAVVGHADDPRFGRGLGDG